MPSLFREKLVLPFLFYDFLQEASEEGTTRLSIYVAFEQTFERLPTQDELDKVVARLQSDAQKLASRQNTPSKNIKKTFGTGFSDYLNELSGDRLCLFVADYNPMLARTLYREADMHQVIESSVEKARFLMEKNHVAYEAVMFGMGGHYKDNGPDDHTIDLCNNPEAGMEQLRKLGFGVLQ